MNRFAAAQHAFVLSTITSAKRRWENFICATSDQFPLFPQAAAFHERLVHNHVFATMVLDEKHQIGNAIEERLANHRFGQLRQQFSA